MCRIGHHTISTSRSLQNIDTVKPNETFRNQSKAFWAHIRSLSEKLGYTVRGKGIIRVHTLDDVIKGMTDLGLSTDHLIDSDKAPTELAETLIAYFEYRADVLNNFVEQQLMDAPAAKMLYESQKSKLQTTVIEPMNKQKGDKKAVAYFTALVNMLIYENANGFDVNFDPRVLTTVTQNGIPLRTLARRVDGAFPTIVDPIAIWEIKEYYYTTTFGSRVAGGVYETLLDGLEIEELNQSENVNVLHYLMIDSHYTWWKSGRSYLCRMIDMLHMGYVDEILFGKEIINRLPSLVSEWRQIASKRGITPSEEPEQSIVVPLEKESET